MTGEVSTDEACPRCQLPRAEDAWQCDGCGFAFSRDLAAVREHLRARLRSTWLTLGAMVVLDVAIVAGFVLLALHRFIYVSGGFFLAALGYTGHAVVTIGRLREQLRDLDRQHQPLPAAIARQPGSPD